MLKLYNVDKKYVEYLRQFDERVSEAKHKRPHIGVVCTINNIEYYVPLSFHRYPICNNQYKCNAVPHLTKFFSALIQMTPFKTLRKYTLLRQTNNRKIVKSMWI